MDPRPSLAYSRFCLHAALLPTWGGALHSELAALRDEKKAWTREGRKVEKASSSLRVFQRAACTKITDACYAGYYERDYPQPKDGLVLGPELACPYCYVDRELQNKQETPQGTHTICLCSRLLFYSKCTGFTVCFTYREISLTSKNRF